MGNTMQHKKQDLITIFIIIVISAFYFWGVQATPFHPDESTQLFMSSDIDDFFTSPDSLFWNENNVDDLKQHYHELDAPLTRYTIGIARWITRTQPLKNDWDWSEPWNVNKANNALPSKKLLLVSRFSVAIFFPVSLLLLHKIGKSIGSPTSGLISVLFFGLNSLIWLHTRRAMAESLLIFNIMFFLYLCIKLKKNIFLLAIPAALAFNAKQTSALLILIGLGLILFKDWKSDWRKIIPSILAYGAIIAAIIILLNPFLWQHPFTAGFAAIENRSEFTENQTQTYSEAAPDLVLDTSVKQISSFLFHSFLAVPIPAESGNYLNNLEDEIQTYYANPLNNLTNTLIVKFLFLILTFSGFIFAILEIVKNPPNPNLLLLMISTILFSLFLILFIKLSFQRYYLPIFPFTCLWAGFAVHKIIHLASKKKLEN